MWPVRIRKTIVYEGGNHRESMRALFVYLEFDGDISGVHPYIHAHTTACRHRTKPAYARFYWRGKECVLYTSSAVVGIFEEREEAGGFGPKLLGLIHDSYRDRDRILPADPDLTPLKAMDVLRILPRTNCRECGHATCLAFSAAVAQGLENPWSCPHFPKPQQSRTSYLIPGGDAGRPIVFQMGQAHRALQEPGTVEGGPETTLDLAQVGNIATLTERELQVLELMALGFSNKEIADNLGISPHTVKTHCVHIFEKLDCTDRTQASVWASRAGLV